MSQYEDFNTEMEYVDIQDLLLEAQKHANEFGWLDQRAEGLLLAMKTALYYKPFRTLAANTLLMIYQWVTVRKHNSQWNGTFYGAVLAYTPNELDYHRKKMQLYLYYGRSEVLLSKSDSAVKKFKWAFDYAITDELREEYIQIYTRFFKNSLHRQALVVSPILFNHAYNLAQELDEDHLCAAIYQSLGEMFLAQFEFIQVRVFCCMALKRWRNIGNNDAIAQTLYVLAISYRSQKRLGRASYYLQRAKTYYARSNNWQQYMQMDYEQAATYFAANDYDTALSWLQQAMRELNSTPEFEDLPRYSASLEQLMGMIQIERKEYSLARQHLQSALQTWRLIENIYESANCLNSLGYLEGKEGHIHEAHAMLDEAEQFCEKLSDVPTRVYIQNLIHQTCDELVE